LTIVFRVEEQIVVIWNGTAAKLEQFLAHRPYHAAFFFVHPQISRLQAAVAELQQTYEWPAIAISPILARLLFPIPPQQWPRSAPRLFHDSLQPYAAGPLLCHDIDLLFEPALHLDPLKLFLDASRHTSLIIAWPGTCTEHSLTYAVPEHAHFHSWPSSELRPHCLVHL